MPVARLQFLRPYFTSFNVNGVFVCAFVVIFSLHFLSYFIIRFSANKVNEFIFYLGLGYTSTSTSTTNGIDENRIQHFFSFSSSIFLCFFFFFVILLFLVLLQFHRIDSTGDVCAVHWNRKRLPTTKKIFF